jgi:release factor glutamine methyltransferase
VTTQPSVREAIAQWAARFEEVGHQSPQLDARLLALHVCDRTYADLIADPHLAFEPQGWELFLTLAERRLDCEPMAYILGEREFWSMAFWVDWSTLIPRPDSEALIEAALFRLKDRNAHWRILDLGTGSGCLLLAMLRELPNAQGLGVDISLEALEMAERNAVRHGLEPRARFMRGDWGRDLSDEFDIIVANPPYIKIEDRQTLARDVVGFEPHSALFGGEDGLDALRAMLPQIGGLLSAQGFFVVEYGADQSTTAGEEIERFGLEVVEFHKDLKGINRCIVAKRADS